MMPSKISLFMLISFSLSLMIVSYFFLDIPIATWIRYHLNSEWRVIGDIMSGLGNAVSLIIFMCLTLIYALFIRKNKLMARYIFRGILILIAVALLVDLIKILAGRARPSAYFHYGRYGFYGLQFKAKMWSFPSGHTAATSAFLTHFYHYRRQHAWIYISLAFAIGISRMLVEAHWLSDIVAGCLLGYLMALLMTRFVFRPLTF